MRAADAPTEYTPSVPSASTTTPLRPASVPAAAVWEPKFEFWRVGGCDAQGRWEGPQTTYRLDGSLQSEFVSVAGKPNGPFRRFHPNGDISMIGEHHFGELVGSRTLYRSATLSDEAVRDCCLPSSAAKVVMHHRADGRILEDYYDASGARILEDGSPYPDVPKSVSPDAHFHFNDQTWVAGTYERGFPHGNVTYWGKTGERREVAHYKHGKLDGIRERYANNECVERRMYAEGEPHGPAWERIAQGHFERAAIAAREGSYEKDEPVGKWRYLDAAGHPLLSVDLGPMLTEVSLDDVAALTEPHSEPPTLHPSLRHVRRLLHAAQRAAQHGDPTTLTDVIDSVPQLTREASERWLRSLQTEPLAPPRHLAKILRGLMRGVRTEHVFRTLASAFSRKPNVGLSFLRVALLLAPNDVDNLATEILLYTGCGQLGKARACISRMRESHPTEAADLAFNLQVTFPTFDYWPARTELGSDVSPDLPSGAAQPIRNLRQALSKAAIRLTSVRRSLKALAGEEGHEFELPPDVGAWLHQEPATLESYTFEAEGDTIEVQEPLDAQGYSLTELMLQARIEWTTLCWLHFATGASSEGFSTGELPSAVTPRSDYGAAITRAFQELYRVADQVQTGGIRSHRQGVPNCTWEGRKVTELSRGLVVQAFLEYRERRAALFFAGDATCSSAWQDDLRST